MEQHAFVNNKCGLCGIEYFEFMNIDNYGKIKQKLESFKKHLALRYITRETLES